MRDKNNAKMPNGKVPGSIKNAGISRSLGGHGASKADLMRGHTGGGSGTKKVQQKGNEGLAGSGKGFLHRGLPNDR